MTLTADRPCQDWCTTDEAEATAKARAPGTIDQETLAFCIDAASGWLYRESGRQYPGECDAAIRPEPWADRGGYGRVDRRPRKGSYREIDLAHSPVTEVTGVWVDGTVVPASSYRVDSDHWLVRIDGESWPNRQDWTLDPKTDDNSGMTVEFAWGLAPPPDGKLAAIILSVEVARAFLDNPAADLPANLETLTREGIAIALAEGQTVAPEGRTGIPDVDRFLKSSNPGRAAERPRFINPDRPRRYRRTTSDVGGS